MADKKVTQELGLDVLEVDEAEYAVVPVKGNIPDSIHEAWKYVLEVFFPENGYRHSGAPGFEVYKRVIYTLMIMRWPYGYQL